MTVALKVYTTAGVLQGTVTGALGRAEHEVSTPGMSDVQVPDELSSLLTTDRVVRVELDSVEVAAGLVRPVDKTADDGGGMRSFTLPGVLHLLGDGLQYPPGGMSGGMTDVQEVWYGWGHPEFDATGYSVALSWGTVQSVPLPTPRPVGFPDPSAQLITSAASLGQAGRDDYYWADFTLAAQTRMGFYFAADDEMDVALQGALIASIRGPNRGDNFTTAIYDLPAGTYRVAAKVRNLNRGSNTQNATWFCGAGIVLDSNDEPTGTVVFRTTTSWVHDSDPASPPGLTPGEILRLALEEVQGRGTTLLDDVSLGFTDANDSDGSAWPDELNIPVRVGSSLLTLVQDLAAAGVQVWMDPDLTLQARAGTGDDLTATVTLNPVSWSRPGEQATRLLTWTANGWVEATSGASTRYERHMSLGGWLDGEADQQTSQALTDWAAGRETAVFRVEPGSAAKLPMVDFFLGDVVAGDDMDGTTADWLVTRLELSRDGEHYVWDVTGVKQ